MSAQLDSDVKALLKQHEYLQVVEVGEGEQKRVRVRCDLTQHELLPHKDAIEAFLKTKKFLKAKEWYCYDYSKYEPYIVAHRRKPKCLYCNVTGTVLNRIPAEVEKHVNGKKFQRLKDHVNFTKGKNGDEEDGDFDANAFEFENQQLIYSDEEDEEEAPKKKEGDSDDEEEEEEEEDDEEEEDELEEDEEDESDGQIDDDMAEFYPQEDDESEDEHIREAVKRLTMKKRKASGDDAETDSADDREKGAESKPSKAKKQKKEKDNTLKEKSEEPKKKVKHQPKMNAKERKKAKRAEYIKNKQAKK